jgi:creatinine amidohydrolase
VTDDEMREAVANEYRYERLTWPEINIAAEMEKVIVLPIGSIEQHGHHLPMDVDVRLTSTIATEAGKRASSDLLIMPAVTFGYCHHVMDFPGTITVEPSTFVRLLIDIGRSVAHHGFKRIVMVNGHGSNAHLVEQAGRQVNLQTNAMCCTLSWWQLIAEYWNREVRESGPGGSAHACELETSVYLHIDPDGVRRDRISGAMPSFVTDVPGGETWQWVDLTLGAGPASIIDWTSSYSETGSFGAPELATAEKGELVFERAVDQLVELGRWLKGRPDDSRKDHHSKPPALPPAFGFWGLSDE